MDSNERLRRQRFIPRHKVYPDYYQQTLNVANNIPPYIRRMLEDVIGKIRKQNNLANDNQMDLLRKYF